MIDLDQLKAAAEQATKGPWYATCSSDATEPCANDAIWTVGDMDDDENWNTDAGCSGYGLYKKDADFIALFNPATALTLLARLEAAVKVVEAVSTLDWEFSEEHGPYICTHEEGQAIVTALAAYDEAAR